LKHDGGAVAPTVALSLFALIAVGGLAFDYSRLASVDTELQQAADQAALAAATQLDGQPRALERAAAAAVSLIANGTRFSNDGQGFGIDVTPNLTFYATKADAEADTNPFTDVTRFKDAKFVKVVVETREALYALTPIVGAIRSGNLDARATAGLGSAICKVPPLMICNPTAGSTFDAAAYRGIGIRSIANQGNAWSPGGFGYLGGLDANSTQEGMAFQNPTFSCQNIDTGQVDTGNPTPAINAVNTRFDIQNFSGGGGTTLNPCLTAGACPPALNVTKDVVLPAGSTNCKLSGSNPWQLPANRFAPKADTTYDSTELLDSDGLIDAMGLPRDNCHYASYGTACTGGNLGNGQWARADYVAKYHSASPPPSTVVTRYEMYRWEIDNNRIPGSPGNPTPATPNGLQHGTPVCDATVPDPARDRRVFVVAIANNCSALHGAAVPAAITSWVEVFFVEPGLNDRGNGETNGEIYLEVVGPANVGTAQVLRRDTPYLVK
jgi:Flp pilus assembly protein TadG